MTNPQRQIQQRVLARAKAIGMSSEEVAANVHNSPLYGEFSYGTYRNLVTEEFEPGRKPRTTFNKQLLIALSAVLECTVNDLATEDELSAIRDAPYRRAQWPDFMLEKEVNGNLRTRVPTPGKTASILNAYMKQYGLTSYTNFAHSLSNNGYTITPKQLVRAIGPNRNANMTRKWVTYELCNAAASVFERVDPFHAEFKAEWLITCREGRCPHCDPRLISL
jgi:hypothetical protein